MGFFKIMQIKNSREKKYKGPPFEIKKKPKEKNEIKVIIKPKQKNKIKPINKISKEISQNKKNNKNTFTKFVKIKKWQKTTKKNFNSKKFIFQKYFLTLKIRIILSTLIIFLTLISFEIISTKTENIFFYIIIIFLTILNISSSIVYLISIYWWGKYLKTMHIITRNTNIFFYSGICKIILFFFLLIFPSYYFFQKISGQYSTTFYINKTIFGYNRDISDFFLILNFTVHYFNTISCLIYSWRKNSFFFVKNEDGLIYIIKILLYEKQIFFVLSIFLIFWLYFGVIIRISEMGYINNLSIQKKFLIKNSQKLNFETNFKNNNNINYKNFRNLYTFTNYRNCFWNVLITMTTIGYGDIVVKTGFSRIFQFFISMMGMILISFFIFTSNKFFQMDKYQDKVYGLFDKIESKECMKYEVNIAFGKMVKIFLKRKKKLKDMRLKRLVVRKNEVLEKKMKVIEEKKELKKNKRKK